MKIQGAKKVHYDSGPNMTPLVDVVMVILIFLMLAGSFAGSTRFLMSKQGIHTKGAGKADPNAPIEALIDVHLNTTASGFRAEGEGISALTPEQLRDQLKAKHDNYAHNGLKIPEVDLYPSRTMKYEYVLQAYQAALAADYEKVAFATTGH